MLKQSLSQRMLQKLSPQQIQFIKLLQVPTTMLEQRIKEELEINPALEEGPIQEQPSEYDFSSDDDTSGSTDEPYEEHSGNDDVDIEGYLELDDTPDYKYADSNYESDEDKDYQAPITVSTSFHDLLEDQLHMLELDDRKLKIGIQIIGSIDEDGYLRRQLYSIVDDLAFSQNITCTEDEILDLLEEIQQFEPSGVGARDLKECLALQLERKHHSPEAINALRIINEAFEEYSKKHFEKVLKTLELKAAELKAAHDEILKLNPKPGGSSQASSNSAQQIVPDFVIHNNNGVLELRLNARNAPELRISQEYRDMFKQYDKSKDKKLKETVGFVKQKLDAAKWFIDAVKQRQHTLLSTMEAIMQFQYECFATGDKSKLHPMILKDIANIVGLDISTISRVANSKYVQTEFGTFLLKSFFSEGIMTDSGEEASSLEVKQILQDCVDAEDKSDPLSDEKISELLQEKGYNIARRTVAKYREQLHIAVARLRKEL